MIAEAFAYAIVVTALIGVAAASAESALAALGRPRRLAWLGAYAVAVVFPLAALLAADAPAADAMLATSAAAPAASSPIDWDALLIQLWARGHDAHAARLRRRVDSPRDPRQELAARGERRSAGRARRRRRARGARRFQAAHRSTALARRGRRIVSGARSWPTSSSTLPLATKPSSWRLSSSRCCCLGICRSGGSRGGCARPSRSTATHAYCEEASTRGTTPTCCSRSGNVVRHRPTSPQRSSSP